jgi:hypothetical protein
MATIKMTGSGYSICPEGKHIFRIWRVDYNKDFGKLLVYMVNAQGITHIENFSLMYQNGDMNEKACTAFSFFAKTALNNFSVEEIDHTDLIGRYIGAEIEHTVLPSTKNPGEKVTYANLGKNKWVADGFDTKPVPKALTLGTKEKAEEKPAEKPAEKPVETGSVDLNSLLG